jgi:hypothetical protein
MSWPIEIPMLKDGETILSAQDINPVIEALALRTTLLKENIINESVINGVGFSDIGLKGCLEGQFVAYDSKKQKYIPAEAVWNSDNALPNEAACVIGLLISKVVDTDDRGTILVSGIIRNIELVNKIVGGNHIPGNYYLKDNGNVTRIVDDIKFPIYCGNLTATGCFVLGIQVPDFRTHTHTCYTLNNNNWKSSAGTKMYYDSEADPSIKNILRTYLASLTLVVNNAVLFEHIDYEIKDGYIWLLKDYGPRPNAVLYATNPFMGVVKWLTAMTTAEGNELLKISQSGSTAILDIQLPTTSDDARPGKAVTNITNKGVEFGDVVHAITAGPGITLTSKGTGSYDIAATSYLQRCIELNVLNGNGIVYGGSASCLFKFPAGKESSVIGTVRAPSGYGKLKAKLFMYADSLGSASPTAEGIVNVLTAYEDGSVAVVDAGKYNFGKPAGRSGVINCTTGEFTVNSDDLLNITVLANPSNTISVRAIGVMFERILS